MGRRFHRGFTAAEKTELWDRWKRGECCVDRLSRHLISGHAVDGTACQVCAISGSGRAHSINLFHPTHNPRPIFFKRPLSHKQSQMIARRDLVADIFRLRSYQPLHCKQLFRSNHFVGDPSKKIHRKLQAREVNLLPQRDEASGSEFVAPI